MHGVVNCLASVKRHWSQCCCCRALKNAIWSNFMFPGRMALDTVYHRLQSLAQILYTSALMHGCMWRKSALGILIVCMNDNVNEFRRRVRNGVCLLPAELLIA